jgi:hypothetical protein
VLGSLLLALGACSSGGSEDSAPAASAGAEDAVTAAPAKLDRHAQVAQLFVVGVRLENLPPATGFP